MAKRPMLQWILLCGAMSAIPICAEPMTAETFADHASKPDLTDEQIYTIEKLIDNVRWEFDKSYWRESIKLTDERRKENYQPKFNQKHVAPASALLEKRDWLSLQRVNAVRPVRDIGALRFFNQVEGLSLGENEISDISALAGFKELRRLLLKENPLRDLSPLVGCSKLEELDIARNPIEDFSVLAKLPSLKQLTISADQLPTLGRVESLPDLVELHVWSIEAEPADSLRLLPLMPKLSSLSGIRSKSLAGVERFPSLRNLSVDGDFDSLEPLAGLRALTHLHIITTSEVRDLKPLGGLAGLKSIWIVSDSSTLDLEPLVAIPRLRDVTVRCAGVEPAALAPFRKKLGSWDEDFHLATPRHAPSQKLEVLDQKAFEALDHQAPHGTWNPEGNSNMLGSEVDWLDEKLKAAFDKWLQEDEDYYFHRWQVECRWRDVQVTSEKSLDSLPRVIADIQDVLCHSKNDWIIYLQSEGEEETEEFKIWVYPDKVVVAEEHAELIRKLLSKK
ncbi:hypothetical protein OKA04_07495 [Luteolibacter flavescens]|uniref:Leucine-rich repeat domain-containing protein n=1 Tax=Luteolibacter flavescens TaxID=1859460 RepID=A0ABT3FM97_9BACT|nr:leucine-rich repeat domain-containing protein [Luteolibacter flavescens]MCW1884572.1 hypothetical protein [Luteolibacter flavescens]